MNARSERALYAIAVAALGVLLVSGEFVYVWAPIPRGVPGRSGIACAAGAVLVVAAIGLLWRRTERAAAAVLIAVFAAWLVALQVPRIVAAPREELLWSGAAQLATVIAGAWLVLARVRWARWLYAAALPMFGLHHFLNAAGSMQAVPAWLPLRLAWAYATGVAHVAAGLALIFGIVPRLAATLEAIMVIAFVLLVHVPGTIAQPRQPLQWTMLIVALAIGGAGWIVARSYPRAQT